MKVVILAGGMGTRLSEQTEVRPKPMVEIGGRPILWHIMKHYARHGFTEFVLALGYKGESIKRYFCDYHSMGHNLTVRLRDGATALIDSAPVEDWTVHLVDTGFDVMTGGRLRRLAPLLRESTFMLTYGDGVSNIDLKALLDFHRRQGLLATVTAVRPPARFGGIHLEGDQVKEFKEKGQTDAGWINGGFMVLEPGIFDYLEADSTILEAHALERAARDGKLAAFRHVGFWQCMDTVRDLKLLEELWLRGAPWKTW